MRAFFCTCLLSLLPALAAQSEESGRAWELKLKSKPVVGEKLDSAKSNSMKTAMKMTQDNQVLKEEAKDEIGSFEFTRETTAVSGEEVTEATWTFRKATHVKDGTEAPYGFQGKAVKGKRGADGSWAFTCEDGSEIAPEDLAGVKDATGKKKKRAPGEPDLDEAFIPKNPVKVGESWTPDLQALAKSFGGDNMVVDVEDSKASCTLKSVEERDGTSYGEITVEIDLSVTSIKPMTFNEPFHFLVRFDINTCIDGTRSDGVMKATIKLDGTRKATILQGQKKIAFEMTLGFDGKMEETRKTAK